MNDDGGDRRPPILAGRQRRVTRWRTGVGVVNQLLAGNYPGPAALHEAAVALADADRGRCAVGDIGNPNGLISVEDTVKRLIFIAGVIGVRRVVHASTQAADVAADGLVADDARLGVDGGWVAAVVNVDDLGQS